MKTLFFSIWIAALAGLVLPLSATAFTRYDFEPMYFSEPPYPVLDHCVVESNGVYHLFYLRGNPAASIGHATTTDFAHWQLQPPVLSPGTWDNMALWAPHIIQAGSAWLMYYTGVNLQWSQQSGLALSPDLYDWFKNSGPVYHPDPAWADWATNRFVHGRDPHVMEHNGKYYMFLTAKTIGGLGAIACGVSTDFMNWSDAGPLYLHPNWHVLESIFILPHAGKFHMFFTEEAVYGTSHISSDSLLSGWSIADRRIIDLGHAPQVTVLSDGTQIFSRHNVYNNNYGTQYYTLRFDTLAWNSGIPAPFKPWALAGDWTVIEGNAFPFQPTFDNNPSARGVVIPKTFQGTGWVGTYEAYTGPMGFGYPGSVQGDNAQGTIRSRTFQITGNSMSVLVGGGNKPSDCYIALKDASNGQTLFSETGKDSEMLDRRYWDLRPYAGRNVYIDIVDHSTEPFGHINVDDIVESSEIVGAQVNPTGDGLGRKRPGTNIAPYGTGVPDAAALHPNVPNPFNPVTTISFDVPAFARVRIDVFSADGRHLRTLVHDDREAGRFSVAWDGRDENGGLAGSGVYFCRMNVGGRTVQTRKMILLK